MKNLFSAARFLLEDLASTLLFLVLYLLTNNLLVSVGVGMALGVAQISWSLAHRRTIGTMPWSMRCLEASVRPPVAQASIRAHSLTSSPSAVTSVRPTVVIWPM